MCREWIKCCTNIVEIKNTLIVADGYLQLVGDKMVPDSMDPRLESFFPHSSQVSIYHIKV